MNTLGYFSVHRTIFESFRKKSPYIFKLWIWMLGMADYQGGNTGSFYTTTRDMVEVLSHNEGFRGVNLSNRTIRNYINDLMISQRISASVSRRGSERGWVIRVLNYSEYQGKECGALPGAVPGAVPGALPAEPSTPLYKKEKKNNVPTDVGPVNAEKFIFKVPVGIPQGLIDHMESGTMPEPYLKWGIRTCKKNGVDPKHIQDLFEEFVSWWKGTGKKKQDWYATWQNRLKQVGWDRIRAKDEKNYNHGWEESHKGKFDGLQLPPEIGSVQDHWEPKLSSR